MIARNRLEASQIEIRIPTETSRRPESESCIRAIWSTTSFLASGGRTSSSVDSNCVTVRLPTLSADPADPGERSGRARTEIVSTRARNGTRASIA